MTFPTAMRGPKLHDLRAEKAVLFDEAQLLLDTAEQEGRDFTLDEEAKFNSVTEEIEQLSNQIEAGQLQRDKMMLAANAQLNAKPTTPFDAARIGGYQSGTQAMTLAQKTLLATKPKCFTGPNALADAAASGEFIRNVISGDIRNTMVEGDPSAGGYLVPQQLSRAIIDSRENVGVSRRTAKVVGMESDTLSLPKLISGPAISYVGEAGTMTPVPQFWGQVSLYAKKRSCLVKISNELLSDSVVNLGEYIAQRAAFELAKQEDNEFINGDGTSAFGGETGLLASLGSAGVFAPANGGGKEVWGGLEMEDLVATMGKLPAEFGGSTSWICSRDFYYGAMLKILAGAGGNTLVSLEAGGATQPTFLGDPVYLTSQMPRTTGTSQVSALYGSFSEAAIIGDRVNLQVAISTEKYFEEDCTALRVIARYDINCHETGDSSNAGAVVGLSTAAS